MGYKHSKATVSNVETSISYLIIIDTLKHMSYQNTLTAKLEIIEQIWKEHPSPQQWLSIAHIVDKTILTLIIHRVDAVNKLLFLDIPLSDRLVKTLIYTKANKCLDSVQFTPCQCIDIANTIYSHFYHDYMFLSVSLKTIYATALECLNSEHMVTIGDPNEQDPISYEQITSPFLMCNNPTRTHTYNKNTYQEYLRIQKANAIYCPVCRSLMRPYLYTIV